MVQQTMFLRGQYEVETPPLYPPAIDEESIEESDDDDDEEKDSE